MKDRGAHRTTDHVTDETTVGTTVTTDAGAKAGIAVDSDRGAKIDTETEGADVTDIDGKVAHQADQITIGDQTVEDGAQHEVTKTEVDQHPVNVSPINIGNVTKPHITLSWQDLNLEIEKNKT